MDLFLKKVIHLHVLPADVTFDRGPQYISHFWNQLLQTFGTSVNLSTTHHPQTDGQPIESTKSSNNTSGVQSATNNTIGWTSHGGICLQ